MIRRPRGTPAPMTTSPFEPDPHLGEERIAAADPGQGAPNTADGFGPPGSDDSAGEDDREDS